MHRYRHAFTMIELLIVIGILAVLAGLTLFAMRSIGGSTKGHSTKVTLENLRAMLGELETTTRLGREPPAWLWQFGGPVILSGSGPNFWRFPGPAQPAPDTRLDLDAPGLVTADGGEVAIVSRNASRAVLNTTLAMSIIASVPANRTAIQNMRSEEFFYPQWVSNGEMLPGPSLDHVLNTTDDTTEPVQYVIGCRVQHKNAADGTVHNYICGASHALSTEPMPGASSGDWIEDPRPVPMLKDGWGNPIIFVPASGLRVRLLLDQDKNDPANTNQTRIVTSAGEIDVPTTIKPTPLPAGAKPFFASAGPDGDFSTGDDNIYSFQN